MSTTDATTETVAEAEEQFENGDVAAAFQTLTAEVERLNEAKTELEERVDELETTITTTADVHLQDGDIQNLTVEASDSNDTVPLGMLIKGKASRSVVEDLEHDVDRLLDGEADVVVRSETGSDPLPIESMIVQQQNGTGGLSANKERATIIFPAFGGRAESWGGEMKLDSHGVRTILGDKTDKDAEDWNYNTVKRAMRQVAKATSKKPEQDRDPKDEDNLLTLRMGEKRLQLVADREEWQEFCNDRAED